jgi:tetratricopeptide (TPR) repeat protein
LVVGIVSTLIAIAGPILHNLVWASAVRREDWTRAAQVERVLTWMGRNEPAYLNRQATERRQREDLLGAEERYRASLALYPSPEAWAGLAWVRLARGDEYGAMAAYEQGLRLHPTADLWVNVGALYSRQGRPADALDAYEAALRIDRGHLFALRLAAQAWLERGDRDKAVERLTYAASIAPEDESIRAELARALR